MGDRIDILDHVPVRDARYCKKLMKDLGVKVDTEEVLLSGKGLIDFCSMSHMVCLEVLWLNDNNITKIKGLDTNVQLKCLYLHNNRINTLVGSLKYLKHILTLTLNNNRLQDLEATLPLISHISRLEDLDLSGNPLANEVNYRLRVINTFRNLKVLDRHEVTEEERMKSRVMFEGIKVAHTAFGRTKPNWKNPPAQEIACLSLTTKEMYKQIDKFKEVKGNEEREAQLAASMSMSRPRTMLNVTAVPLASGVETMNSKRLKDVLDDYGQKKDRGQKKVYGDYFTMRRFVRDVTPQVSLEETLSLSRQPSAVSRRSSSSINLGREEKLPADDKITLDQERYQMYEELKKKPAVQSQLANYIFHVKS